MNTIMGYEFAAADNDAHLPSAAGVQNGITTATTATTATPPEPEDVILVASGLLPRLVERTRLEGLK